MRTPFARVITSRCPQLTVSPFVPKSLPLGHLGCTQNGTFALSPSITWTSGALKQAIVPLRQMQRRVLILILGRRVQGTSLHTGLLGRRLMQGLSPLGGRGHAFI